MVCVPVVIVGTVTLTSPFVSVPVPRLVVPSRNVTVPVAPVVTTAVNVTGCVDVEGFSEDVTEIVGVPLLTVTVVAGEVAGLLFASPGVLAVIGSEPTGSVVTVMVATPPTTGTVPRTVPPSVNVTGPDTPVGNVSVIVSEPPSVMVGEDTVGAGSVGSCLFTVCVRGDEVAVPLFASPPKDAVIVCGPADNVAVANVAVPPASVPVPNEVPPSRNVTVPVALFETVAVNVTD